MIEKYNHQFLILPAVGVSKEKEIVEDELITTYYFIIVWLIIGWIILLFQTVQKVQNETDSE